MKIEGVNTLGDALMVRNLDSLGRIVIPIENKKATWH
jgi:hypothetical protein